MLQADPNKIKNYYVDLAPGRSIDVGSQNGYPRISAQAPGRTVTVAQVVRLSEAGRHDKGILSTQLACTDQKCCRLRVLRPHHQSRTLLDVICRC